MEFILAGREDAKGVYELVQETIRTIYPKFYLPEIVEMFCDLHCEENVRKDVESGYVYVLKEGDELIGTGTHIEKHIARVFVRPKYQGKGCGTLIMKRLEAIVGERYDRASIDSSLPACELYAYLGYRTVDHGKWEGNNGVTLVYEIMEKRLRTKVTGLRLRPYKPQDGAIIAGWCTDERAFRKWCSDRFPTYPITGDDINDKYFNHNGDCEEPDNFYPVIAEDENGPVGHLILRYTNPEKTDIRLGFIIVDGSKRGMGYGKKMIRLAVQYAVEILKAKRITLGVFDNNPPAYHCYKAAGFREIPMEKEIILEILGEQWRIIEMEINIR